MARRSGPGRGCLPPHPRPGARATADAGTGAYPAPELGALVVGLPSGSSVLLVGADAGVDPVQPSPSDPGALRATCVAWPVGTRRETTDGIGSDRFDVAVVRAERALPLPDEYRTVLRLAHRALRPGGTLVLTEPGAGHPIAAYAGWLHETGFAGLTVCPWPGHVLLRSRRPD